MRHISAGPAPKQSPVNVYCGVPVTPVPLTDTVCGLPAALSENETVPLRLPVVVGTKVTLMAQFAPAASVEPQVFVWAKFAPAEILAIVSAAVPELVSVMTKGWLAVPTTSSPNVKPFVEKEMLGDERETFGDPPPPQPVSAQHPSSMSRSEFRKMPPLRPG